MDKKVIDLEFICIDKWSRPIFKWVDKTAYFSSTEILFPNKVIAPNNTKEEVISYFKEHSDMITYHGVNMDDDPDGRRSDNWIYNFIID